MLNKEPLIIGIAGAFGSGKSTAADILKNLNFEKISLAQFLEEELRNQGEKEITRKKLQDLGNEWRGKYGSGVLAQKAIALIKEKSVQKAVVEGFRNIAEIKEFRKLKNFKLFGIVANRKIRYERLRKFKRRENLNWEVFNELDNRDLGIGEKETGLQTAICLALSDIFIENNYDLNELSKKLQYAAKEN